MECKRNKKLYSLKDLGKIKESAKKSMQEAMNLLQTEKNALELFSKMKFQKSGFDPLSTEPCNLLEQVNQVFTILMSCYAATNLIEGASYFEFAFAEKSGRDLVAYDSNRNKIAEAEIFTAVSAKNNGKLRKEINRLRDNKDIVQKTKRMVIYTANAEYKKNILPDDDKVTVIFCPLTKFFEWIRSE